MPDDPVVHLLRDHKARMLQLQEQRVEGLTLRWSSLTQTMEAPITYLAHAVTERRKEGPRITAAALAQDDQYRQVLRQLQDEVGAYNRTADSEISAQQLEHGTLGAEVARHAIYTQGYDGTIAPVPAREIDARAGLAGDGATIGDTLARDWPAAADGMTNALLDAANREQSSGETAQAMLTGLAAGLVVVVLVARSEIGRIHREMMRRQFIRSQVVLGYRRLSKRDLKVCPACLMADGEFYQNKADIAEHPQGRCIGVPVLQNRPIPQWELGPQWFRGQDEATQREILGPGRFDAWQAGQFRLEEVAVVKRSRQWGDSLQPAPLKDLTGERPT